MTIATSYARALHSLVSEDSSKGPEYLQQLRSSLTKRGHIKLLPKIFSEYQKLTIQQERSAQHNNVSPEKERVRVLLGLYKKLIETK